MKNKYTQNPSRLVSLKEAYNKGQLTFFEYIRLRTQALKVNVYTGKEINENKDTNKQVK